MLPPRSAAAGLVREKRLEMRACCDLDSTWGVWKVRGVGGSQHTKGVVCRREGKSSERKGAAPHLFRKGYAN